MQMYFYYDDISFAYSNLLLIRSVISRRSLLLITRDGKTGEASRSGPTKSESGLWASVVYD